MPTVTFTKNLQRHIECHGMDVSAATVREALEEVFTAYPKVRSYVLDDQAVLRKHMNIFVDGLPLRDRQGLSDPVEPDSEIYVMQALSGG